MAFDTIDEILALFKGGCGPEPVPPGEVSVIIYPDPLPPEQFSTVDTSQSFVSLFEELVGSTGTDVDQFDTSVLELVGIIDALDAALASGIGDVLESFDLVESIGPASIAEDVVAFNASIPVGAAIVDDFGGLLLPPPPPPGPTFALQITPAQIDFGRVPVGHVSAPQTVTLKNASDKPLRILSVRVVVVDCPLPVSSGGEHLFEIP